MHNQDEHGFDFQNTILEALSESKAIFKDGLNLNANENVMSPLAEKLMASSYHAYYELSDPKQLSDTGNATLKGQLMYRNLGSLKKLFAEAVNILKGQLNASYVDYRLLSGVHAMQCTVLALTEPGQEIWSLSPDHAGHFATQYIVKRSGRISQTLPWNESQMDVDFQALQKMVDVSGQPAMIFLDQSLCIHPLDTHKLRTICPDSIIVYDASHTLGLIIGGEWPNPLDHGCDVIQGNTHKTFPGPQKAIVATRHPTIENKLSESLGSGLLSSQHTHHSAALAVTVLEMGLHAKSYAKKIIENAQLLSRILEMEGLTVMHRPEQNVQGHMVLIRSKEGSDPYLVCRKLMNLGIATNARMISGHCWLRVGTQEFSRRGGSGYHMLTLALMISRVFRGACGKNDQQTVLSLASALRNVKFNIEELQTYTIQKGQYETPTLPRMERRVDSLIS